MISPERIELQVLDTVSFGDPIPGAVDQYTFYALSLTLPDWKEWKSGQFIMLRPQNDAESMTWAIPLSICRVTSFSLVLFFRVVDAATSRISRLRKGEKVIVWGPLGNSFEIRRNTPTLLLARGVGIAPFAGYVDIHPQPENLHMLFGHTLSKNHYPMDSLETRLELEHIRDNSPEEPAEFVRIVRDKMLEFKKKKGICLACGPMAFLRTVWKFAMEMNLSTQLSLEQKMACGIGACLGCSTVTSKKWKDPVYAGLPVQTCTNGPVFWAEEIDLDAEIPTRAY